MPIGDTCWVDYAEKLRKAMYGQKCFELQIPVETIHADSGTNESLDALRSAGFWNAVRDRKKDWDTLPRNGILVDFEVNAAGRIDEVTFRLDEKRRAHLQRVIERSG